MKNKKIIQRNLPLNTKYNLVGIKYIPIIEGGCTCDNCNTPIANIATVKDANGKIYQIGMDCLDTVILNNKLLDNESYAQYILSDKPAIEKAKQLRNKILRQQKKDSSFKAEIYRCKDGKRFGFSFSQIKGLRNDYEPAGFDFTFNTVYIDLTIAYLHGLPNVII